ncbi:hypothetical protein WME75_03775 [Sorangium sp. So ce1014]|uniref:hypothetical protein n=1 Tax=Sorangium sp. So ce1014 TaxID=3133326 RepID=UPI003F624536
MDMGSNKDSDDIRQYLPDLESIQREADPAVAERKLQQALDNPELDRALSEMQHQKAAGQPLFQFPVVPALPKGQAAPQGAGQPQGAGPPQRAVPPPLPVMETQRSVMPPLPVMETQRSVTRQGAASQHGPMMPQHVGVMPPGGAPQQRASAPSGAPVPLYGGAAAPLYGGAAAPVYGGAAAVHGAAAPRGAVVGPSAAVQQGAPASHGAMAPSQWADRGLPPIDRALLPSSLLPVTPPPVTTQKPPADAQATAEGRWRRRWWVVALALLALSMPFVTLAIARRQTPPKEKEPAPRSSGAPARSAVAPPVASELPPPEEVEPSLDDVVTESDPPAPQAPARPAPAAPRPPQAPVAPVPADKPLADDVME